MEARDALELAALRWRAGDDGGVVKALLEAHRDRSHPRIADLLDRASERVATGPIVAKTVKARTEVWLARAARLDPLDVADLLATPLPGAWKEARRIAEALGRFPDDPRIAQAMAHVVRRAPWDSWGARLFYQDILAIIAKVCDARTLPLLAAALEHPHGTSWDQGTRPLVEATRLTVARSVTSQLPPRVEESLCVLEALFAAEVTAHATRGDADFVNAIYDDPDDDALRMVYADWLTERGDPRGELIALQLARCQGRGTAGALERERALLGEHRDAWLGPLARVLDVERSTFERGFLAYARFRFKDYPTELPLEMASPALATVTAVDVMGRVNEVDLAAAVARIPALQSTRAWHRFRLATLLELAADGPRPRIREVSTLLEPRDEGQAASEDALLARGLPGLKVVTVAAGLDVALRFLRGELGARLERFALYSTAAAMPLGALVALVDELQLPLHEVAVIGQTIEWRIALERDPGGRLARLRATHGAHGAARLPRADVLVDTLATLEPHQLTELVVERLPCSYGTDELRALDAAIARFPRLATVDVPWQRLGAGRELSLHFWPDLADRAATLAKVWRAASESPLSLAFDAYDVDEKGHQNLPAGGELAAAQKLAAKKRTRSLAVYDKAKPHTARIVVHQQSAAITCPFGDAPDFVDRYLDWLERLAEVVSLTGAEVAFDPAPAFGNLEPFDHHPRWLHVLPLHAANLVAFDHVLEVAAAFPWVRARRIGESIALVLGEAFDRPPRPEQLEAFAAALVERSWETYGFCPRDVAVAVLAAPLEAAGFARVQVAPVEHASGRVLFARGNGRQTVVFYQYRGNLTAVVQLGDERRAHRWPTTGYYGMADDPEKLRAELEAIVAKLPELLAWFG